MSETTGVNRVKSGPGPLRKIYDKITALENEVNHLKSELRLVKKKLNNYERKGSASVKDVIVDRIKEQQFSVTLTPVSDDSSINIVQQPSASRTGNHHTIRNGNTESENIYVEHKIFDQELNSQQRILPNDNGDTLDGMVEETISDNIETYPMEIEKKLITVHPVSRKRKSSLNVIVEGASRCGESGPLIQIPGSNKRRTKRLDPVWNEFTVLFGPNDKKTVNCRHCGQRVSPEAPRLKNHFAKCPGLYGEQPAKPKRPRISRKKSITTSESRTQHEEVDPSDPEFIPATILKEQLVRKADYSLDGGENNEQDQNKSDPFLELVSDNTTATSLTNHDAKNYSGLELEDVEIN